MASTARNDHRRDIYMPLKLKRILMEHDLLQADLCRAVLQMNGRPLSKTAGGYITNFGQFPKESPQHSIEEQIRAFLRAGGVPEAEIEHAFEADADAQAAHPRPPMGRPLHLGPSDLAIHVEPVMLTLAAKRYFKLPSDPFNREVTTHEDVFRGPDQDYVTECIAEAIANDRLFALVGESGSGKSTLWEDYKEKVREEGLAVRIIQPKVVNKDRISDLGVMGGIVRAMAPHMALRQRAEDLTEQAHALLAESAASNKNVLLFEEAHDLPLQFIKELKRIHEFKAGRKRLLSVVLIGQPELLTLLGRNATGKAREVAQRLEIARLLPLDDQLEGYVAHRLAAYRREVGEIFAPSAFDAVRRHLRGTVERQGQLAEVSLAYPLRVNNLLVAAMNNAEDIKAPKVDAAIVTDAFKRGA